MMLSAGANKEFKPAVDPSLLNQAPDAQTNPPPPDNKKYFPFFQEWQQKLQGSSEKSLPCIDAGCKKAFVATCQAVQSAVQAQKDAENLLARLQKQSGRAVQIYHLIQPSHHPVLQRLALAVALELANLYQLFNKKGYTDALQRYVHYEQAFLLGELDPDFSHFNVWELRQVVNLDATEDKLSVGQQSVLNYRPNLALTQDAAWRYCFIVKSDVDYTNPDWYKDSPSYDQILLGGGKCGPRAWYGWFICKAFGIPTWGVKQPGHAAMMRWTRNGWTVLLGGGRSWWDDQGGLDFFLKTHIILEIRTPYYWSVRLPFPVPAPRRPFVGL